MKEVGAGCVCDKVFMDETLKISGENVQNKRMRGKKKKKNERRPEPKQNPKTPAEEERID